MTDLIVDANSIYARAWYAAKEEPDKAIIAALNIAMMLYNPERVGESIDRSLFCWDGGQKHAKGREERPKAYEDTKVEVQAAVEFLFGTQNVRIEPYEADDLIATAAINSRADHVIIASADKDLLQLNGPKISIFDINSHGLVSKREILARWHIKHPNQLAYALAIEGDKSDKIVGVKGWGPKKVEKLFEAITPEMEFDAVFDKLMEQMPPDKQEEFLTALNLTLLQTDVPGVPDAVPVKFSNPSDLRQIGLGELSQYYTALCRQYGHSAGPRNREED